MIGQEYYQDNTHLRPRRAARSLEVNHANHGAPVFRPVPWLMLAALLACPLNQGCGEDGGNPNSDAALMDAPGADMKRLDAQGEDRAITDLPLADAPADLAVVDAPRADKAAPDKASPDVTPPDAGSPDAAVPPVWSKHFGGPGYDYVDHAAVDPSGNIYVAGHFWNTLTIGSVTLKSAGNDDGYLVKLDKTGKVLWSKSMSSSGTVQIRAVACDSGGNVVLAAVIMDSVTWGGKQFSGPGSVDVLVSRLDSTGKPLWTKVFGGKSSDSVEGLALDPSGNVLLAGYFQDSIGFGGTSLTSAGSLDIFMAKLGPDASHKWSQRFGDNTTDRAYAVAADSKGGVVITGKFTKKVSFGGSTLTGFGGGNTFLAKYDSAGKHQWSTSFPSNMSNRGVALAVDSKDAIALAGAFKGGISLGGKNLPATGWNEDIYLGKFSASGTHLWSQRFGEKDGDDPTGLAFDAKGDLLLAASFVGSVSFGGNPIKVVDSTEGVIAKYDGNGKYKWNWAAVGKGWDNVSAVAVDSAGAVFAAGHFASDTTLGGTVYQSLGSSDIYVVKLKP